MRALSRLVTSDGRPGDYDLLLAFSEEIRHEGIEHISDSAVVESPGVGRGRDPAGAGSNLKLTAVRPQELSALGILRIDADLHYR